MRIVIHRGAHQIGGTCIEVATDSTRIILDAGLPLDADPSGPLPLPNVPGLWSKGEKPVDALFLTHAHADHSGLVRASQSEISVYLTTDTSKLLLAGSLFARQPQVPRKRGKRLEAGKPVQIGNLCVTAFPVDHSTQGAVAFLVEDGQHRLFYTGDLRFHGRWPKRAVAIQEALSSKPLDALLIEGTRFGERASEKNESESQLLERMEKRCREHEGPVFVSYSPLHVDRFRTLHDLATRLGRRFVIDPYQDFVLHLLRGDLPRPSEEGRLCTVLMPDAWSPAALNWLKNKAWFTEMHTRALRPEEVRAFWERAVVLYRPSMDNWLFEGMYPSNSLFLYSYWTGYLKQEAQKAWLAKVRAFGAKMESAHASGHAHPDDLLGFVNAIKPRVLVPVHTEHPQAWAKAYPLTRLVADGEVLEV
ncbi:MAG: MBL fold metallo-hydrolase [Opitutaceae bacterium]|nr:MBL fold metallo-hydrolase [Opitutaceae bacterium]